MVWKKCCGLVGLRPCVLKASGVGIYPLTSVYERTVVAISQNQSRFFGATARPRGTSESDSNTECGGGRGERSRGRESSKMDWAKKISFLGISSLLLGQYLFTGKRYRKSAESEAAVITNNQPIGTSFFQNLLDRYVFQVAHCTEDGNHSKRSKQFNFLAEAVDLAAPSVVYIEKQEQVGTFFGTAIVMSSGSGFIVDDGTYVLTNAHVVGNTRKVKVKLISGRMLTGEVTDVDQTADLALVKLDLPSGEKLPALKFGSSSDLRPGEWVVAVGSPLSLENTITAGIVSSVHRPSKELGLDRYGKPDSMGYVQTDAAITVGNSGGPLMNLDGEVIGVNNMTAGPGISFAIPSDFASDFVRNASKTVQRKQTRSGRDRYAIGISMLSLSPNVLRTIRSTFSLPSDVSNGVLVATVWPNGAASRAGLKRGDVIVRVNGMNIETSRDLNEMVQSGKRLTMEIVRKSQWMTIIVVPEPY